MKRVLLAVVLTAMLAAPAAAQYGNIGVYSEPGGCNCDIYDTGPAVVVDVYVVHRYIYEGVQGSSFIVTGDPGMTMIFLAEYPIGGPIFILGNIVDGYTVSYGSCLTGGLAIMRISYLSLGTSVPCSMLEVSPAPTSVTGQVEVWDCGDVVHPAGGGVAMVNPLGCHCSDPFCQPVPVEESTWGGIKALYQ